MHDRLSMRILCLLAIIARISCLNLPSKLHHHHHHHDGQQLPGFPDQTSHSLKNRRDFWNAAAAATTCGGSVLWSQPESAAASGLASKLAQRDPAVLTNSIFNIPPGAQVYPEFLRGQWEIQCRFGGFLFPSKQIPKERLVQNVVIPGFQKCSIAAVCDVGKENVVYRMAIDPATGLEDRASTFQSQIRGFLGYDAVNQVFYQPQSNPNRISIDFVEYRTVNAERIELFVNARESEWVPSTGVFCASEYLRQVTFGTGSVVGIPRQVVGNYAHFWTWRCPEDDQARPDTVTGNLLTAAYLDPQDAMFFAEPSKPVAVYSHVLTARRI